MLDEKTHAYVGPPDDGASGFHLPEDAQPMGWDDCGGGQIYYGSDSEGSFPIQVYGTGKENHSTAQAAGIVNMEEFGTYLGNGTYSFRR